MSRNLVLLLTLLFLISCKKKQINYYELLSINDVKLEMPKPGEWRYNRKEDFQKFEDFQKIKKIIPSENQKKIYLLPIGKFSELEWKEIEKTRDYLEIYFQLNTQIIPEFSDNVVPETERRSFEGRQEQLNAGYILENILVKNKPKDASVLMGFTAKDIFPKKDWNYVFGLASYEAGVGITSIYRFHDGNLTQENFTKSLERTIKISSHEIGHMFGISHCLQANCVMNGTNSLEETDSHFARACSLCQKKLNASLDLTKTKRLLELQIFFEKNNLFLEKKRVEKDLAILQKHLR